MKACRIYRRGTKVAFFAGKNKNLNFGIVAEKADNLYTIVNNKNKKQSIPVHDILCELPAVR